MTPISRWLFAFTILSAGVARADTFSVQLWAPGVVNGAPNTAKNVGVENFDRQAAGSAMFTSSFGGGPISGSYSGAFNVRSADQYGGAGGTGQYISSAQSGSNYTLTFRTTGQVPGVNYFGFNLTALDSGNIVTFYRNLLPIAEFNAAYFAKLLGSCSGSAYCGNPMTGQNTGEAYGFFGFTDQSGFIDQVRFTQSGSGGLLESDNHTVAYVAATQQAGVIQVPEPAGVALLAAALLGLGVYRSARPGTAQGTRAAAARLDRNTIRS